MSASPRTPRLRFAPSPTGFLHVGGARTALLNWLYARKHNGEFLLRVEDTDRARSTEASTQAIFDGLRWLGLDWDGDVVFQALGLERHQRDASRLLERDSAYRCFCTATELDAARTAAEARGDSYRYDRRCAALSLAEADSRAGRGNPFVVRFRVPSGTTEWDDAVHGRIAFPNKDIEDFVVLRSDGTPIYNMAVVSDDIEMRITFVMRGDDHISNTPKQILIYRALGAELPRFGHVPNVNGTDGRKLSKRHGATAVGDYRDDGILPSAMVNFLALLGWSPGDDREVMALEEMIRAFSEEGLQKKSAVFDPKKLEWMNGQHLSRTPATKLAPLVARELVAAGTATEAELTARNDWFLVLIDLLKVRARTTHDFVPQAVAYFAEEIEYDATAVARAWKDPGTADLLRIARERLAALPEWSELPMEHALRTIAEDRGLAAGKVFQPIRVALTGSGVSPGIFEVLGVMGRTLALHRLDRAFERLTQPV
ncbi:MAG: glutamate--tRNA ligase [Gemmatimonadaceae bacterium]